MGLPGKKLSSSSKRRRAAQYALKKTALHACAECGSIKRPHYACPSCHARGKTTARSGGARARSK